MRHLLFLAPGSLLFGFAHPAHGQMQSHAIWVAPTDDARGDAVPALMTLPAGWSVGDAAAIIIHSKDDAPGLRAHLRDALMAEDAAVLEVPIAATAAAPALLSGALRNLVIQQGAGVVVAFGLGASAKAVVVEAQRARRNGWDAADARLAAGFGIDGARVEIAAGAEPIDEEGWPLRALLLCAAIRPAMPRGGDACVTSLLGRSPG